MPGILGFRLDCQTSYDRLSKEYAERYFHELDDKPFDRRLLNLLAKCVGRKELICDMGCGPGQIARYLHERGCRVLGMDLSRGMIQTAKKLNPDIDFQQGDMLKLEVDDNSWGQRVRINSYFFKTREIERFLIQSGFLIEESLERNPYLDVEYQSRRSYIFSSKPE